MSKEIISLNEYTKEGRLFLDHGYEPHVKAYLPTSYRDNHASNLIELENGDILCTWFAGLSEGSSDVKVALARLNKGSDRWTAPVLITDDYNCSEQNPSIFQAQDGRLWLLHPAQQARGKMTVEEWQRKLKVGEVKGAFTMQETAEVRLRYSEDNGYTWSESISLFTKPGAFCRHPIKVLSNGDWIFPMWYSQPSDDPDAQYGDDYSAVQISTDQGQTWSEYEVPNSARRVHMNVVETRPGHIVAFFRSRSADRIYRAFSEDHGRTWTAPTATSLPNNNSSIQAIRLQSGAIAMIFNYAKHGDDPDTVVWGTPRCPIVVALTYDEGETFPYMRVLEPGDGFFGDDMAKNHAYHYPCIMQSRDGKLHISYTHYGRSCIMYHRIDEDWIKGPEKLKG